MSAPRETDALDPITIEQAAEIERTVFEQGHICRAAFCWCTKDARECFTESILDRRSSAISQASIVDSLDVYLERLRYVVELIQIGRDRIARH